MCAVPPPPLSNPSLKPACSSGSLAEACCPCQTQQAFPNNVRWKRHEAQYATRAEAEASSTLPLPAVPLPCRMLC